MQDQNNDLNPETLDIVRRMIADSADKPEPVKTPAPAPGLAEEVVAPGLAEEIVAPKPAPETAPTFVPDTEADPDPTPETRPVNDPPRPAVAPVYHTVPLAPVARPVPRDPVPPVLPELAEEELKPRPRRDWRKAIARALRPAKQFMLRPEAPRELALALLAVSAIVWPWIVAGFVALVVVVVTITWFTLGPDRVAELVVDWHARLALRDPDKAETIRLRAARVSRAITRTVERLPDRWTTGFYLPDFEPSQDMPEKMKDDPFDRLKAQVRDYEGADARA